jgi:hypothetical protein
VNNLAQVICRDIDGFTNGNDGPVMDEADTGLQDADVIWRFDMFEELGFRPGYAACTSPTLAGSACRHIISMLMAPSARGSGPTFPSTGGMPWKPPLAASWAPSLDLVFG